MPWTTHGPVDHQTFGERTVIMAAKGVDGENLGPEADQQNLRFANMADELAAIGKSVERYALRQVRTGGLGLIFSHGVPTFVTARFLTFVHTQTFRFPDWFPEVAILELRRCVPTEGVAAEHHAHDH